MNNLSNWLSTFEELKEQRQPVFKKHLVAEELNEHEQNIYAVLHAAFILFNGSITKNQERLYSFWLHSISEDLKLSEVINQAQEFDSEKLKEAIALIENKELFELILLDVLVFTRLEGGLSNDLKQILNEWCQLLNIKKEAIESVVSISDHILGVDEPKQPKLTSTIESLFKNQVWSEFYIKALNKSNINNVSGGIWCIEEDILDVSGGIVVNDALLVFYNGAKITSYDGEVAFNNTGLVNPVFEFKSVDLYFDNVIGKGQYNVDGKITAFSSIRTGEVKINRCHFELTGSRAFMFDESNTSGMFENVTFNKCGNEFLLGGAVKYQEGLKFTNCEFNNCVANVGGGVFSRRLIKESFISCDFINSLSITEWEDGKNAGCLYTRDDGNAKKMIDCYLSNNVSIYKLENCASGGSLLCNSKINGVVCYYTEYNANYTYCLDDNSVMINGIDNNKSKNNFTGVKEWSELVNDESCQFA